ncbi:MAG: sigma-70 family RNA polymerase sigma factor [Planctomycetota bacterium]
MCDEDALSDNAWPTDDWFHELADGNPRVVEEFWQKYAGPLRRVADRQISASLGKRVDAEDIVQSACRTFFRRAGQGEFECTDQDDLWRLMLTITLNKARMQARFHGRARRGVSQERSLDADPSLANDHVEQAIEAVDFADFLETVFAKLDDESRRILERMLDGQTQDEIAAAVGCSQRTVRRMKGRIRDDLTSLLRDQLEMTP